MMRVRPPGDKRRLAGLLLLALPVLLACAVLNFPMRAAINRTGLMTPSPSLVIWPTWTAAPVKSTPQSTSSPAPRRTGSPLPTTTPTPTATLLPVACLPPGGEATYATVLWVNSGDTIVVDIQGELRSVHYLGVRAAPVRPSVGFYGPPAATQNAELVVGQVVKLLTDGITDRDELGRLERYVVLSGTDSFLNYELIRRGLAEYDPDSPALACGEVLEFAQQSASLEQLGRWAATPTLPPTPPQTPTFTAVPPDALTASATLTPAPSASAALTTTQPPIITFVASVTSLPGGTSAPTQPSATPTVAPTAGPSPTITDTRGPDCDPSYPTVCIKSPPPYLICEDVPYTNFVVLPPDPHFFDLDEDGIGCEPGE